MPLSFQRLRNDWPEILPIPDTLVAHCPYAAIAIHGMLHGQPT